MSKKIPIHVFLSYRSHYVEQLHALEKIFADYNQQADKPYQLKLIASELELKENDNLVDFMDKVGTARFVILMLTHDYFKSSYCLHEMLEIHRNQSTESRLLPLAIKVDESSEKTFPESMIESCKGESGCFPRLIELQKSDSSDVKKRLVDADKELIKPLRDILIPIHDTQKILDRVIEQADIVFEKEQKELTTVLVENITRLIGNISPEDKTSLEKNVIKQKFSKDKELAEHLIIQDSFSALKSMQIWITERDDAIYGNQEWRAFYRTAESICGWLFLKSIDQTWWVHHKLRINRAKKDKNHVAIKTQNSAYLEVVISRDTLEAASFNIGKSGDVITERAHQISKGIKKLSKPITDVFLQDDGIVIDADHNPMAQELLIPMLCDLKFPATDFPDDVREQLKELIDEVDVEIGIVYYFVSANYLQQLETVKVKERFILEQINEAVGDRFFLVSYDNNIKEGDLQACQNEGKLLKIMSKILRVNKIRIDKQRSTV